MARLRKDHDEFRKRNAAVLAVGPDHPEHFRAFWREARLPFTGLPDPDHRVALLYRQEVNLFKLGRMPLVIVIDPAGVIRYHHRAVSMADIPGNHVLLDVIDKMTG